LDLISKITLAHDAMHWPFPAAIIANSLGAERRSALHGIRMNLTILFINLFDVENQLMESASSAISNKMPVP
jgi:hypothetical protein